MVSIEWKKVTDTESGSGSLDDLALARLLYTPVGMAKLFDEDRINEIERPPRTLAYKIRLKDFTAINSAFDTIIVTYSQQKYGDGIYSPVSLILALSNDEDNQVMQRLIEAAKANDKHGVKNLVDFIKLMAIEIRNWDKVTPEVQTDAIEYFRFCIDQKTGTVLLSGEDKINGLIEKVASEFSLDIESEPKPRRLKALLDDLADLLGDIAKYAKRTNARKGTAFDSEA